MSDTVIRVENLGKKYIIGRNREAERYTALRDVIANGAKGLVNKFKHPSLKSQHSNSEEFWALKDVSFEIKQGDRVGIIGQNGAGKSTLLKILSRITEPTTGFTELRGRVSSLLEVGTGFHPELTGRENIFLNGAILGMDKAEIRRKFDEIVDFAEISRFLDTPVKRYSSGMYVRLAFSVAAHLEPEILIIDEVLAVGDANFQKKCLGKIGQVAKGGRTVLFVSHDMGAIHDICEKCILLKNGELSLFEDTRTAVQKYLSDSSLIVSYKASEEKLVRKGFVARITQVSLKNSSNHECMSFSLGETMNVEVNFQVEGFEKALYFMIEIYNSKGQLVCSPYSYESSSTLAQADQGGVARCIIPALPLAIGSYSISVSIGITAQTVDSVKNACNFKVYGGSYFSNGVTISDMKGSCFVLDHRWVFDCN